MLAEAMPSPSEGPENAALTRKEGCEETLLLIVDGEAIPNFDGYVALQWGQP